MKNRKKYLRALLPHATAAVIFLGLSLLALWNFTDSIRSKSREEYRVQLTDYAAYNAAVVEMEMNSTEELIRASAVACGQFDDLQSDAAMEKLKELQAASPFTFMRLTTPDGISRGTNGSVVDISKREHFKRAMQGETTVSDALESLYDQSSVIVFCAPIYKNEKIIGTIQGVYQTDALLSLLEKTGFASYGYTEIVKSDGTYVLSTRPNSEAWSGGNLLDIPMYAQEKTRSQLAEDLLARQAGGITCTLQKESWLVQYQPIGISDWVLLQAVNESIVETHVSPIHRYAYVLVAKIVFLLGCAVAYSVWRSVSEQRVRKADLNRIRNLTNNIPGGVAELAVEDDCVVRYANDGFFALTGYSSAEYMQGFIGGHLERIVLEEDVATLRTAVAEALANNMPLRVEFRIRRADGAVVWLSVDGSRLDDEGEPVLQCIFMDITAQKNTTAAILESARLDRMTRLYDKVGTEEAIGTALEQDLPYVRSALLIFDIDHFKRVNDRFGHQEGDRVIVAMAKLLQENFRASDIAGRIGGDEFMVLMRNVKDSLLVRAKLEDVLRKVSQVTVGKEHETLSCSIGAATFYAAQRPTYTSLYALADKALYEAKNGGRNRYSLHVYGDL